jgi:hypothetical protein
MEGVHVSWLWLNISLMAAFFIAAAGIPLWLVLRRPDFGPQAADQPGRVPAAVAARYAQTRAASAVTTRREAGRISDDALRYGWAGR